MATMSEPGLQEPGISYNVETDVGDDGDGDEPSREAGL